MQRATWRSNARPARRLLGAVALGACALALTSPRAAAAQPGARTPARAQAAPAPEVEVEDGLVQLDFNDVELPVVIDTVARLTGKNFIYDDRVRGRVTIVSPTRVTVDQAYSVFESVLQVKGFTVVAGPGGALKVIPLREAKETSIETVRESAPPESDRFVTRLIPLRFIDAQAIADTLKPLVSKDAAMVAYPPTNTVILSDASSNIRRILDIIESIDVESYKEELSVLKMRHADAATVASQLSEIFGAEVSEAGAAAGAARVARPRRPGAPAVPAGPELLTPAERVRLITDERTNSIIVLAARSRLAEIRRVVSKLDVPVSGGGRIHVYYLKHADAEELSQTLNALVSGQAVPSRGETGGTTSSRTRGARASLASATGAAGGQGLASTITELAEGVMITADPPTNSLVIQASREGFATVSQVIAQLDVERPQVLVEALIMEVDISDGQDLGFSGLVRIVDDDSSYGVGSLTDTGIGPFISSGGDDDDDAADDDDDGGDGADLSDASALLLPLLSSLAGGAGTDFAAAASIQAGTTLIQGVLRASASLAGTNVLSSPNILTSDNEEAEIKVGANIPIITSRVQSASGIEAADSDLATSVNVERQDIGVTLRVTPQISEGDSVRLEIFQEITNVSDALSRVTGDPEEVGVSLSNRKIENTVVVANHETVVIGGLISDDYQDTVSKVPWLGDIPILGWLFKTTGKSLVKSNLLVFLTPHIVRTPPDLERETIRKREEFWERSERGLQLSQSESEEADRRREEAASQGVELPAEEYAGRNPVRGALLEHETRYPAERMRAIELQGEEARRRAEEAERAARHGPGYELLAAVYRSEESATELLTELVDAGYDGSVEAVPSGGVLLYEIRLGPYEDLAAAQQAAETIAQSFGLAPSVVVGDTSAEAPPGDEP